MDLVVSPLVAIMEDQEKTLQSLLQRTPGKIHTQLTNAPFVQISKNIHDQRLMESCPANGHDLRVICGDYCG